MNDHQRQELLAALGDSGRFIQLLDGFIEGTAQEFAEKEPSGAAGGVTYADYFRDAMSVIGREGARAIEGSAGSPIERIFLRSLLLCFVRSDDLGLVVHRTTTDTQSEVAEFRKDLARWREFWDWFRSSKPTPTVEEFLDHELQRGAMSAEERDLLTRWTFLYGYVSRENAFHMSIQPPFPDIKVNGKSIRPDIYFWIPSNPRINIIVECDGFEYHSSRESFKSDRQRDRVLKQRGFDVFRFSGSEINSDPVQAPYQLAEYLWNQRDQR